MNLKHFLITLKRRISLLLWLGQHFNKYGAEFETLAFDLLVFLGLDRNLDYETFVDTFNDWRHTYGLSGAIDEYMKESSGLSFLRVFQNEQARNTFEVFQMLRNPSRLERMYMYWWWGIKL